MSTVHHLWPHRHHDTDLAEGFRWRTVVAGLAALIALTAIIGGLAGVATWAVVRLFGVAMG